MLPPTDTRPLFRPLSNELVALLRGLSPEDWDRPTVAGSWLVRDVVAHIADLTLRRLSFHRDAMIPPPPTRPIASDRDFVAFINDLNAQWIVAARRFSPRVLTDIVERAGAELSDWFESLPLDAPALFGVSWAGERESEGWFDVGREFVEVWHHQQQIRLAVGAPALDDPRFLRPVLEIALRALPHALRDVGRAGDSIVLDVTGGAHGTWTLKRDAERWSLGVDAVADPATRVRVEDTALVRVLFHMLPVDRARSVLAVTGRADLAGPLAAARAVIV